MTRPHILLVYADHVGERMGGVGIRASELARVLARDAEVTLASASYDGTDMGVPVVTFAPHAPGTLRLPLAAADVVVAQPQWPLLMHRLVRSGARLIFDLYDPEFFGTLAHLADRPPSVRRLLSAFTADRIVAALRTGDHVACANERQRDLWLGTMVGARLIHPEDYDRDRTLRSWIDVVAYGVPREPPRRSSEPGPRERFGLAEDDELILWNGGLWSWLDAETPIRAIAILRKRRPRAQLVFMGTGSGPPARRATDAARSLAQALGLLDSGVYFNPDWIPYQRRADWLLEADCAISAHHEDLEAQFASRTRLLDCLWAGLPVVCTAGDAISDRIERDDLGATVAPQDVDGTVDALERVLERGRVAYSDALRRAAEELSWESLAKPLRRWALDPAPRQLRRRIPSTVGERTRAAAYLAAARPLEAMGVRRLRRLL